MRNKLPYILVFVGLFISFFWFNKTYIFVDYGVKNLKFSVELESSEVDVFQLYYREKTTKFAEKLSKRKKVYAQVNKPQWLEYDIPDSIKVSHFRFDFGNNKLTSPVYIHKIILSVNKNKKVISQKEIKEYFEHNKYTIPYKSGYARKVIGNRSDPFLSSIDFEEIINELKNTPKHSVLLLLIVNTILSSLLSISFCYVLYFNMPKIRDQRPIELVFVLSFILILLIPNLDTLFELDTTKISEKRKLSEKPELTYKGINEFPTQFEAYFNDNFGFRKTMISINSIIKIRLFKISPNRDRAIVGDDGCLFIWNNDIRKSYLNNNPFSEENLKVYGNNFIEMKQYASDKDKLFVTSIYPNKHTIYEEKIPSKIRALKKTKRKRIDQIFEFLEKNDIPNIDHRTTLLSKKAKRMLYFKNDTHWNSLGAFYAYQGLLNKISSIHDSVTKPLSLKDYKIIPSEHKKGDLLDLLGIDNRSGIFIDTTYRFIPNKKLSVSRNNNEYGRSSTIITNTNSGNNLTALFFGDSYTYKLLQFLQIHFKKTVFIKNITLNRELIKEINPDIVVYGILERNLENF